MVTAKKLCEQEGLTYINGYNDAAIIAGQGTAALEILEQVGSNESEPTNARVVSLLTDIFSSLLAHT